MQRLNAFLFHCLLLLAVANYAGKGLDLFVRQSRFPHGGLDWRAPLEYLAFAVILAIAAWLFFAASARLRVHHHHCHWWRHANLVASAANKTLAPLSILTLSIFCAFYAYNAANYTLNLAETVCDSVGMYEAAERLNQVNPIHEPDFASSAVWRSSSLLEDDAERDGRTAAVAAVYGPDSVDMARRCWFMGQNLDQVFGLFPRKTETYYRVARSIYHQQGQHGHCGELYIHSAIVANERDKRASLEYLRRAKAELSKSNSDMHMPWTIGIADAISRQSDPELAQWFQHLDKRLHSRERAHHETPLRERMLLATYGACVLTMLSPGAALLQRLRLGAESGQAENTSPWGTVSVRELAALCVVILLAIAWIL
jgi:hypothetical protein